MPRDWYGLSVRWYLSVCHSDQHPVGIQPVTVRLKLNAFGKKTHAPFFNFANHWPPSAAQISHLSPTAKARPEEVSRGYVALGGFATWEGEDSRSEGGHKGADRPKCGVGGSESCWYDCCWWFCGRWFSCWCCPDANAIELVRNTLDINKTEGRSCIPPKKKWRVVSALHFNIFSRYNRTRITNGWEKLRFKSIAASAKVDKSRLSRPGTKFPLSDVYIPYLWIRTLFLFLLASLDQVLSLLLSTQLHSASLSIIDDAQSLIECPFLMSKFHSFTLFHNHHFLKSQNEKKAT